MQSPDDIDKAFAAIIKEGIGALYVNNVPVIWINRRQTLDLAARHRLPAIYQNRTFTVDGGLMAYAEARPDAPAPSGPPAL